MTPNPLDQTTLWTSRWSEEMLRDCQHAQQSITLVAHSIVTPLPKQTGAWPNLWRFLTTQRANQPTLEVYLSAQTSSHPATRTNNRSAEILHKAGAICHLVPPPNILHAKCVIIDNFITWIGSGNMTQAAHSHNHEVWLRHPETAIALDLKFRLKTWE